MGKIHLISNAHLDPEWLWEWEEGAAEAISTFRIAADFCEAYDGFVFNHNEVILYQWVEEYEPELFKRIKSLVERGRWHIMGGWYLQPDCNMPCGESFVRQILAGRQYFMDKFGVEPTTAINFDSFGHSRGLVQIMKKSGYNAYVFGRPFENDCPLPAEDIQWVGYDGSRIMAHRAFGQYGTQRGKAAEKVRKWVTENAGHTEGLILWGVGNHGGGPSKIDIENLNAMMNKTQKYTILHSTPEAYFEDVTASGRILPEVHKSLNSWAVGCYTSQIRIKQRHRKLESELLMIEKMMSCACLNKLLDYPTEAIRQAQEDLLTAQFHDILPGSSIQLVEETSLGMMGHGLEILSKLKARAFFALAAGQHRAFGDEIPIFIFNPHPYLVKGIFECEFQLADQNWNEEFSMPVIYSHDKKLPSQAEQEYSNINLDWRKHSVFAAELLPCTMNRFSCRFEKLPQKPVHILKTEKGSIMFKNGILAVSINCTTGLMDSLKVNGYEYLKGDAFQPLVMQDDADPWGMRVQSFRNIAGRFTIMDSEKGTLFSGVKDTRLESVRVIEDGDVRMVVEALFSFESSFVCQRYKLPKTGTELEVELRVFWNEKNKMLKLSVPTTLTEAEYLGQVAYGVEKLPTTGQEVVAQKWTGLFQEGEGNAFTCINNGTYGSDCMDGEIRLSLLRSPGYSAHPINQRPIMPQDRFSPHIDQGERLFTFWFNAGEREERLDHIDREALVHHEKPFALSFFPDGQGVQPRPALVLKDDVIQMTAFKRAEDGRGYVLRLYNPTDTERTTRLELLPGKGPVQDITLGVFEVKSFRLEEASENLQEIDLMERVFTSEVL